MALKMDILESDRFYTNTDYTITCQIKQADGATAQNVTGWSFSWMLKKRARDADASAILIKTSADGIQITDGPNGIVEVEVSAADTDGSIRSGLYYHELKRTDAGNEVVLIQPSLVRLLQSIHLT